MNTIADQKDAFIIGMIEKKGMFLVVLFLSFLCGACQASEYGRDIIEKTVSLLPHSHVPRFHYDIPLGVIAKHKGPLEEYHLSKDWGALEKEPVLDGRKIVRWNHFSFLAKAFILSSKKWVKQDISPAATETLLTLLQALNEYCLIDGPKHFKNLFATHTALQGAVHRFLSLHYFHPHMTPSLMYLLATHLRKELDSVEALDEEEQQCACLLSQLTEWVIAHSAPCSWKEWLTYPLTIAEHSLRSRSCFNYNTWLFQSTQLEYENHTRRYKGRRFPFIKPFPGELVFAYDIPEVSDYTQSLVFPGWATNLCSDPYGFYKGFCKGWRLLQARYEEQKRDISYRLALLKRVEGDEKSAFASSLSTLYKARLQNLNQFNTIMAQPAYYCLSHNEDENDAIDTLNLTKLFNPYESYSLLNDATVPWWLQGSFFNPQESHIEGSLSLHEFKNYQIMPPLHRLSLYFFLYNAATQNPGLSYNLLTSFSASEKSQCIPFIKHLGDEVVREWIAPFLPLEGDGIVLNEGSELTGYETLSYAALMNPAYMHGIKKIEALEKLGLALVEAENKGDEQAISHLWREHKERVTRWQLQALHKQMHLMSVLKKSLSQDVSDASILEFVNNAHSRYFSEAKKVLIPFVSKLFYAHDNSEIIGALMNRRRGGDSPFNSANFVNEKFEEKYNWLVYYLSTAALVRSDSRFIIDDEAYYYTMLTHKWVKHARNISLDDSPLSSFSDFIPLKPLRHWKAGEHWKRIKNELCSLKIHRCVQLNLRRSSLSFYKEVMHPRYKTYVKKITDVVMAIKRDENYKQYPSSIRKLLLEDYYNDPTTDPEVREYLDWWQKNKHRWRDCRFIIENKKQQEVAVEVDVTKSYFFYETQGRNSMMLAYHFVHQLYESLRERGVLREEPSLRREFESYKDWYEHHICCESLTEMNQIRWIFYDDLYRILSYSSSNEDYFSRLIAHEAEINSQYDQEAAFYDRTIALYTQLLSSLLAYEEHARELSPFPFESMQEDVCRDEDVAYDFQSLERKTQEMFQAWEEIFGPTNDIESYIHRTIYLHTNERVGALRSVPIRSKWHAVQQVLGASPVSDKQLRQEFIATCQDRLKIARGYDACRLLIEEKGGGVAACIALFDPKGEHADKEAFQRDMHALYEFLYSEDARNNDSEPASLHLASVTNAFVRLCEYLLCIKKIYNEVEASA